jgi:hypothetical protein
MKPVRQLLMCFAGIFSAFVTPAISEARADPIALSCVFQGAGGLRSSISVDLQKNTVTDGYSNFQSFPIKEITDSVVKWHEEIPDFSTDNELNRTTGDLVKHIVAQGQAFVWNYSCQRTQKLL